MSYDKVKQAKQYKVGLKQTIKAVERGSAHEVIIAQDAETQIISQVVEACQQFQTPTSYVDSKKELGKACGIEVGAASVAIEK